MAIVLVDLDHALQQSTGTGDNHHIQKKRILLGVSDVHKASVGDPNALISESERNRRGMRANQPTSKDPASHLKKPQKAMHTDFEGKRKGVAFNADYAFTGSYYNVHRNIMNFDPSDLLPQFKGRF